MNISCKCPQCRKQHEITFDSENSLCLSCFKDLIVKKASDPEMKKKYRYWESRKLAVAIILQAPILWIIGYKFGLTAELVGGVMFLYGSTFNLIRDKIMDFVG